MLINCNSCNKKFMVPDSAITESGRLVQCGTCGNKWTQFPIKEKKITQTKKEFSTKIVKKPESKKITRRKKLNKIERYSEEYLQKKHGIQIIEKKSKDYKNEKNKTKSKVNKSREIGFGFYSYLIFLIIFIFTSFGVVNLTKEIIIDSYPKSETYINYLYEIIEILNAVIFQLFNKF